MKRNLLLKTMLLLCALVVGSSSVCGQTAVVGTELWKESFKGSPTNSTTFSATSSWNDYLNKSTFVVSDASSLTYSTNNAMANSGIVTNMDGAHVWLNKNTAGYFQVTGIKLYNASKVKVSWAQAGGSTVKIAYAFDGGTTYTDLSSNSSASEKYESAELDVTNHTTINLKFYRTSTKTNVRLDNLILTATNVVDNTKVATPEITGAQNFLESTTVGISCDTDGSAIQYSTDDGTTWNNYFGEFNLTVTTTIKAKASKSGLTDSDVASATFTKRTPVTVTEALTAIAALDNNETSAAQCVRGIVSTAGSLSSGKINYYISTDGTTANQLYIYGGKGLNNANFTASTDIKVGDEVVVFGTYKKLVSGNTTTLEVIDGYLLAISKKTTPIFNLDKAEIELTMGNTETADVALTTNTDGTITCESDDEDVAIVALKSPGVYTITAKTAGTATITIKSALSATYYPANATVAVTVADNRTAAGISFAKTSVTKTWGDNFTGQELTNTNNLDVTWSSTNEAVATVNGEGAVTVIKAGTTNIKATFAGDATYKAAVASYTLTVNKAEAGLSYATTNYNVELFDKSFVTPVLTNPNNLTVTYASDKVAVAEVNENTGAIILNTNAVGKATITASFAGNDNYLTGYASYTINVIDPSVFVLDYNNNVFGVTAGFDQEDELEYTANGITLTLKRGGTEIQPRMDGGKTSSKYLRLYAHASNTTGDNTMKVTAPSYSVITKIVFDFNKGSVTESGKTYSSSATTWTGSAADVTFTAAETTWINSMMVTLAPTVLVTTAKYASYVTTLATDFANTEGVTAYKVTAANATTITMEPIETAPKGTPVILKAEAESYALKLATSAPIAINDNLLQAGPVTGDGTSYYVLGKDAGGNLGFGLLKAGVELPATKAYLPVSAIGAKVAFIPFDSETTAIDFVVAEPIDTYAPMYNLAGQRVTKNYKGVVIVNGKKMLNK